MSSNNKALIPPQKTDAIAFVPTLEKECFW